MAAQQSRPNFSLQGARRSFEKFSNGCRKLPSRNRRKAHKYGQPRRLDRRAVGWQWKWDG